MLYYIPQDTTMTKTERKVRLKLVFKESLIVINNMWLLGDQGPPGPPGLRGPTGPQGDSGLPGDLWLIQIVHEDFISQWKRKYVTLLYFYRDTWAPRTSRYIVAPSLDLFFFPFVVNFHALKNQCIYFLLGIPGNPGQPGVKGMEALLFLALQTPINGINNSKRTHNNVSFRWNWTSRKDHQCRWDLVINRVGEHNTWLNQASLHQFCSLHLSTDVLVIIRLWAESKR